MQLRQSLATSDAVDRLILWGRPCGLPNLVSIKFKFLAYLFIKDTKWFIHDSISYGFETFNLPPHAAKDKAASFPLGSINPYNKF